MKKEKVEPDLTWMLLNVPTYLDTKNIVREVCTLGEEEP